MYCVNGLNLNIHWWFNIIKLIGIFLLVISTRSTAGYAILQTRCNENMSGVFTEIRSHFV